MKRALLIIIITAAVAVLGGPATPRRRTGSQAASDFAAAARGTLSHTSGTVRVKHLEHAVSVLRDRWGVPHIYAQSQHDLFFAQGFVAAQDRLFQMELWKRVGQGRLAEILGPEFLKRDINARLLRYRGPSEAEYASYGPDTRAILEAFTAGINEYIRHRLLPDGPGLPVEFRLAGFAPEPWKPEDCLMRLAGFPMTGNAGRELFSAQLVALIGAERTSRLLPLDPPVKLDPAPGVDYSGLTPDLLRDLVGSDSRIDFPAAPGSQGSNNWTVAGILTRSGRPLLANDPHRTIALPSLRYIVHLVAPGWDVIGAGEPALPGIAVGHNQHIAWGFTVFGLDQQDLYLERLDASDSLRYKTPTGWERMRVEKETLKVKGKPDFLAELKFSRHGPVLWEDPAHHRALALRWVGSEPGTAGYLGSLAVDRARNWDEFEAAMARWKVPSENIVYADTAGHIGEHSVGLAPLRRKWTGLLPVPGDGTYEWEGFVPSSRLPHSQNPPDGFIATANHRMIPPGYPYQVGFQWAPPDRFLRIQEVLSQAARTKHVLDAADMENLQNDVVTLPARDLVGLLSRACARPDTTADADRPSSSQWTASTPDHENYRLQPSPPLGERVASVASRVRGWTQYSRNKQPAEPDPIAADTIAAGEQSSPPPACSTRAAQLLMKWDGAVTRESAAAALYEMWRPEVERAVFRRLAPESVRKLFEGRWPLPVVMQHLLRPDAATFGPHPQAVRDRLLLDAISPAVDKLSKLEGPDLAGWQWGKLHQVRFRHPLDKAPGAEGLFDLGPLARPGDASTVDATSSDSHFEQVSGASYRQIMDTSDWDRSEAVNVPGQSGQPASPHYSDLLPLWAEGRYFPLVYSRPAVERETIDRLELVPDQP